MTGPRTSPSRVLALATQGAGGDDEARLRGLLEGVDAEFFPFDKARKRASALDLIRTIRRRRPDLVVMEGTGVAGGLVLLLGRLLGTPYVVSSGDAVGPYVGAKRPWLWPPFALYERALCRGAAGFIGWTPYLTGRALSFGAGRGMTAPGWAPFQRDSEDLASARVEVRSRYGIDQDALVVGLVGSLSWNSRFEFCYGADLVRAVGRSPRPDLVALVVGDGTGRPHLERLAGSDLGHRVVLPGRVSREEVPNVLAAMDLGSLPQSVDGVGSFRYTTKISEYLAARLPIVTTQIPAAYDLEDGWAWRIAGDAPWKTDYLDALTAFLDGLTPADVAVKRAAVPTTPTEFDRQRQVHRAANFINDLLRERAVKTPD